MCKSSMSIQATVNDRKKITVEQVKLKKLKND